MVKSWRAQQRVLGPGPVFSLCLPAATGKQVLLHHRPKHQPEYIVKLRGCELNSLSKVRTSLWDSIMAMESRLTPAANRTFSKHDEKWWFCAFYCLKIYSACMHSFWNNASIYEHGEDEPNLDSHKWLVFLTANSQETMIRIFKLEQHIACDLELWEHGDIEMYTQLAVISLTAKICRTYKCTLQLELSTGITDTNLLH